MQTTRTDETGNKLNQTPKKNSLFIAYTLPPRHHPSYDGRLLRMKREIRLRKAYLILPIVFRSEDVCNDFFLLLPFSQTENFGCSSRLRYS